MVGSDSRRRLSDSTFPSLSGTLKSTRTMTRLPETGRSSTKSFLPVLMVGAGLAGEGAGCRGWESSRWSGVRFDQGPSARGRRPLTLGAAIFSEPLRSGCPARALSLVPEDTPRAPGRPLDRFSPASGDSCRPLAGCVLGRLHRSTAVSPPFDVLTALRYKRHQ